MGLVEKEEVSVASSSQGRAFLLLVMVLILEVFV